MVREARYIVLKGTDVESGLTETEKKILATLCRKVESHREEAGKKPLKCVVIESDWPEYEKVWDMVEERVDASEKPIKERLPSAALIQKAIHREMPYMYRIKDGLLAGMFIASNAPSTKRLTRYSGYKIMPFSTNMTAGLHTGKIIANTCFVGGDMSAFEIV